ATAAGGERPRTACRDRARCVGGSARRLAAPRRDVETLELKVLNRPISMLIEPGLTHTDQPAVCTAGRTHMSSNLHRESAYYLAHQETLARLYAGQVIVIKGGC